SGAAERIFREAGVDLATARERLTVLIAGTGTRLPGRHGGPDELSVVPRVRWAVGSAADEARQRGRAQVGIEHLLLGLLRAADRTDARIARRAALGARMEGSAEGVLARMGVDPDRLQQVIEQRLG